MTIGLMFSGILSGAFATVWLLLAGAPVLLALIAYPLGGLIGSAAFIMMAMGYTRYIPAPPSLQAASADSRQN